MRVFWLDNDEKYWYSTDSPTEPVAEVYPTLPDLRVTIRQTLLADGRRLGDIEAQGTRDDILYMARSCLLELTVGDGYITMKGEYISLSELHRRIDAALDSLGLRFEEPV